MNCETPPPDTLPAECYIYTPGVWDQDVYTIPIEALAVAAVSNRTPPEKPRWPFANEVATAERNPTRQPGLFATALAGGMVVPLVGSILKDDPHFPVYTHFRGLIHSHLWTEFLTSSAKSWFGRKRPFYDTVERRGESRQDDRYSFFSGHSSHSFAFATYASRIAFSVLKDPQLSWFYAILLNSSATWVASSRAFDKQHNWSDVIVGSLVGAGIGYLTFERVNSVRQFPVTVSLGFRQVNLSLEIH